MSSVASEMSEDGLFKKFIAASSYGSSNRCIICIFLSVFICENISKTWWKSGTYLVKRAWFLLLSAGKDPGERSQEKGGEGGAFVWIIDWWYHRFLRYICDIYMWGWDDFGGEWFQIDAMISGEKLAAKLEREILVAAIKWKTWRHKRWKVDVPSESEKDPFWKR